MIKVGEYVRSLVNGGISKILEVSDLLEEPNVKYYKTGKFTGFCSTELYNIKHSPNIIDLIEEGDYVNGCKVMEVCLDSPSGSWIEVDNNKPSIETALWNEDIKSIVTKEQFAQVEYKVED